LVLLMVSVLDDKSLVDIGSITTAVGLQLEEAHPRSIILGS